MKITCLKVFLLMFFFNINLVNSYFVTTSAYAKAVTIQSDGKIVLAGQADSGGILNFALARCNSDGTLDSTFNSAGDITGVPGTAVTPFLLFDPTITVSYANSVIIQNDEKIVLAGLANVGGNVNFAIARYNTDGTLDTNFNGNGYVTTPPSTFNIGANFAQSNAVSIDSNGNIVAAGFVIINGAVNLAVARYTSNGILDTTFNFTGTIIIPPVYFSAFSVQANALEIQDDNTIFVVGTTNQGSGGYSSFVVLKFNNNGTLDSSFNGTGMQLTPPVAFGGNLTAQANSVAIQSDGNIIAVGFCDSNNNAFALARYNTGGTLDTNFNGVGTLATSASYFDSTATVANAFAAAIQSDGKIVVAGQTNPGGGGTSGFAVARYNIDGTLDGTFNSGPFFGTIVTSPLFFTGAIVGVIANSLMIQSDEKIVSAGVGTALVTGGYTFTLAVARYNTDGSLDSSFNTTPLAGATPQ